MRTSLLILASGALALGACSQRPSSSNNASTEPAQAATPPTQPVATTQADAATPALRICADPGNMPLSNQAGEGYQNKIAQVLGKSMGLPVQYYWRTYYERGLARGTINSGKCDVLMDMPADYEMGLVTKPYFRSTYVLVSGGEHPLKPSSLDDPALKQARVGVFQSSPARGALYDHGIKGEVQYLFYDSARNPEQHPARLVEQVAKGSLDAAESWGPVAGYYAKRNALTMVPLNRLSDTVLEYSMSLAVSEDNQALRDRLDKALADNRDAIRAILQDYDVPLVACTDCVISGDIPSHGPYAEPPPYRDQPVSDPQVLAQMQERVHAGASADTELRSAVAANDPARVKWLLANGANGNALDDQGRLPLQHAIRLRELAVGDALLNGGAGLDARDGDGWTPLMTALWTGDAETIDWLLRRKPKLDVVSSDGWTPLSVAIHNGDEALVAKVLDAGAPPAQANPAGFTPLMFAATENQAGTVQRLLKAKVPVDHANQAGITALMLAVAAHRQELVRTLIAAGADPTHSDAKGESAISLARQSGDAALLALVSGQSTH